MTTYLDMPRTEVFHWVLGFTIKTWTQDSKATAVYKNLHILQRFTIGRHTSDTKKRCKRNANLPDFASMYYVHSKLL